MEDLYYAIKQNGQFQKAKIIDSVNTNMPDAAISLSNDGRVLYLYQDLDDGHGLSLSEGGRGHDAFLAEVFFASLLLALDEAWGKAFPHGIQDQQIQRRARIPKA